MENLQIILHMVKSCFCRLCKTIQQYDIYMNNWPRQQESQFFETSKMSKHSYLVLSLIHTEICEKCIIYSIHGRINKYLLNLITHTNITALIEFLQKSILQAQRNSVSVGSSVDYNCRAGVVSP